MSEDPALIMAVDDDADFLDIYRHILQRGGYRVACCATPDEAVAAMEEDPPRLIITDLMMDTLHSGFTFARAIRQDPRYGRIPIIIVTAAGSQRGFDFRPQTGEDLEAMCVDAYFDKPVEPKQLLAKIAELLAVSSREVAT